VVPYSIVCSDKFLLSLDEAYPLIPLYNITRMQRRGSECGVYALYAVVSFLVSEGTDHAFSDICRKVVDDASMNDFRRSFFIDSGLRA
jgi:hypothetical protein